LLHSGTSIKLIRWLKSVLISWLTTWLISWLTSCIDCLHELLHELLVAGQALVAMALRTIL